MEVLEISSDIYDYNKDEIIKIMNSSPGALGTMQGNMDNSLFMICSLFLSINYLGMQGQLFAKTLYICFF